MIAATIYDFTEAKEGSKIGIYYNIIIHSEEDVKTSGKRYSDFLQLHEHLISLNYPLILDFPFPRKSLINGFLNKIKIASERKELLNQYLCLLLSIEPVAKAVLEFLGLPVKDDTTILPDSSYIAAPTQPKLLSKSTENNVTDSRYSSSKRKMIILLLGVLVVILLTLVTFVRKVRNIYGKGYVNSEILGSCSNTLLPHGNVLVIFKSWESMRFWIHILVSIIMFFAFFHRLLGKLFGIYVRYRLGRKRIGSFLVEVEWIGIRLGFDRNEILIHNVMFKNPPLFTNTPFFVSVEDVLIR
jgi:hypothetical protein